MVLVRGLEDDCNLQVSEPINVFVRGDKDVGDEKKEK